MSWRATAHHLTRNRAFLAKAVAVILGVSALIAMMVNVSRQRASVPPSVKQEPVAAFKASVNYEVKRLEALKETAPEMLLTWIRRTAKVWTIEPAVRASGFDAAALRLAGAELNPLLEKHAKAGAQRDAMEAYMRVRFLENGEARLSAFETLRQIARETPVTHASEMVGDAFLIDGRSEEALEAFLREIETPEASYSRQVAVQLALGLQDADSLKHLAKSERTISDMSPDARLEVARQIGDQRLLVRAVLETQLARWFQIEGVALALIAGAIWYIILVHSASREVLRWWRYLPAVFAGIVSLCLLRWMQTTLNYFQEPHLAPSAAHELMRWIMYVGLPEEAAKLALVVFFLPVLLHNGSGVKAALTAGCVGLGFALQENLKYFLEMGPLEAVGRLLTANFFHVAVTGIVGYHLYELFRSKFHHATQFLTAFFAVVVAHGLYDFTTGKAATEWGINIAGYIILALCARQYLRLLHDEATPRPAGYAISRSSVFLLGTAFLGGIMMIVAVWHTGSLKGITEVLKELAGLAVVGLFYLREWQEVH